MEQLRLWKEKQFGGKKYSVTSLAEGSDGLQLDLFETATGEGDIQLSFPSIVCAYKNLSESFAFKYVHDLFQHYERRFITQNTFFVVDDSVFSKEVEEECYEMFTIDRLLHFKIIASDSIIDVVTFQEPEITTK